LYWYNVHGRIVAGEWASKFALLVDGVRLRRSDAALVRIVAPIDGGNRAAAEHEAVSFARGVLPALDRLWSQ
jgi:EpsI family protein